MRRFAFVALAVVLAACGAPEAVVGEQSVVFVTPASQDSALARVSRELAQLGFSIGGRQENLVFTTPRPLPAATRTGTTARDTMPQLWFVHVLADDRLFRGGSNVTVRGYFVPQTGMLSPGNVVQEQALPVTSARTEAFRELRRIAGLLHAALER